MKLYVALLESNVVTNRTDYEKLINEKTIKVNNKIVSDLEQEVYIYAVIDVKDKGKFKMDDLGYANKII